MTHKLGHDIINYGNNIIKLCPSLGAYISVVSDFEMIFAMCCPFGGFI